jgi:hypothetical protein
MKRNNEKTTTKKIVISSIVLVMALVAVIIAPSTRAATPPPAGALALGGVWNAQVTLKPGCGSFTLPPFEARHMFNADGTLASTDNTPQPGNGPGFGTWQYMGGRNFAAHFEFYFFNPTTGAWAGTAKINLTITLGTDGNSFTANIAFARYGTSGALLVSGCGTETDTRQE